MNALWWTLPGPRRFASEVADDLRDGSNVVVLLPAHVPDGIDRAVRVELGDNALWTALDLGAREADGCGDDTAERADSPSIRDPIATLSRRIIPHPGTGFQGDVAALAAHEDFAGRALWIDGLDRAAWPAWRDFLSDYTGVALKRPLLDRTVLCLVARGIAACAPPTPRIGLSVRAWKGVVDPLDTLLYVSQVFPARPISRLERRVSISIIASLALWDPVLCDILVREDLPCLLDPHAVLADLARARGWMDDEPTRKRAARGPQGRTSLSETGGQGQRQTPPSDAYAWSRGMTDSYGGSVCWHPCALTPDRRAAEVRRRVWEGQVRELLPLTEERRRVLIDGLGDVLITPWDVRRQGLVVDVIDDREALEIAHIDDQLRTRQLLGAAGRRAVGRLRDARNDLAHLRVVPASVVRAIADDDISALLDNI